MKTAKVVIYLFKSTITYSKKSQKLLHFYNNNNNSLFQTLVHIRCDLRTGYNSLMTKSQYE